MTTKHISTLILRPQPGECNSIINTGKVFTLQKSLECDCSDDPALTVDGQGTVLDLNGHTVQCTIANISFGAVVEVIGTNNAVKGPGTREYIHKHIM